MAHATKNLAQILLKKLLRLVKNTKKLFHKKDAKHLTTMQQMRSLVKDAVGMKKWYEERKKVFDSLPED